MTEEFRTSDTLSSTLRVDAKAFKTDIGAPEIEGSHMLEVVDADFAREQERTIAILVAALQPFTRTEVFNQCDQIRDLITQISGNPVNGADAWRWWLGRHFNISMFKDAAIAIQRATQS